MNMTRVALLIFSLFVLSALIYLPCRLVAQQINTATFGTVPLGAPGPFDGNFVHTSAILVWPTFMFLVGLVAQAAVSTCKQNVYVRLFVGALMLVVLYCMPVLDALVGIRSGGLNGFSEFTMRPAGLSTPFISAIACPLSFIAGSLCACWFTWVRRGERKEI